MNKWLDNLQHRELDAANMPVVKNTRHKKIQDIKNQCFMSCIEYSNSEPMTRLLENAARNVLPKNCSIRNSALAYTSSGKTYTIKLDLNPKALYDEMCYLATNYLGVVLPMIEQDSTTSPKKKQNLYREAKKQKIKFFIQTHGHDFGWSYDKIDDEHKKIMNLFQNKKLKPNNIKYDDGKILSIDKLNITEDGVIFSGNNKEIKTKAKPTYIFIGNLYAKINANRLSIRGRTPLITNQKTDTTINVLPCQLEPQQIKPVGTSQKDLAVPGNDYSR